MQDVRQGGGVLSLDCTERRRFKRVPVLRPVKYIHEKFGETSSMMLDLSLGGAYIESPVVPVDSKIEMIFPLLKGESMRVKGMVRYVVLGRGMGVEFQELSDGDRGQIAEFIDSFRVPASSRRGVL